MNVLSRFLRRSAGTAAAAALLTPTLLATAPPAAVTPTPQTPAQHLVAFGAPPGVSEPLESKPVHLVVLVDESGSLSDDAVRDEENAAALIAQSELSKNSQISVVGFGGNNGRQPNQSAIDLVCPPTTVAGAPDREKLARCVSALHPRTPDEGDSTDFAKALSQALSLLPTAVGEQPGVIFLLTDGKLDVSDDSQYGNTADQRNQAALDQVGDSLRLANQRNIQVWTLGFGNDIDSDQLAAFAAGGSQRTCSPGSPRPRYRPADNSSAVVQSLVEAYAAATCASVQIPGHVPLPSGQTRELPVDIPYIATDGSIAVIKRDPRVQVNYLAPDGHIVPKTGTQGESVFEVSGEGSAVEVLRIRNPDPGRWRVRLSSAADVPAQNVNAVVIWKGAVRSSVFVDPPAPVPGQVITVTVTVETRKAAVTDPRALAFLRVGARLTGDGFAPVETPLADDGKGVDGTAGDGKFTGQLTMPSTATGAFRLVGSVAGEGVSGDERHSEGQVIQRGTQVSAQIRVDTRQVPPGGSLSGTLVVTNDSGQERRGRLVVTPLAEGTQVTVTPVLYDLPASGRRPYEFELAVDRRSALGVSFASLRLVDDANPDNPAGRFGETLVRLDVGYPPPLLRRLLWLWLTLGGLVLAGLATLAYVALRRRADRDVRGLVMVLGREDRQLSHLPAPDQPGSEFRFVIKDADSVQPRLDLASGTDRAYTTRRGPAGQVVVRTPSGGEFTLLPGRREEVLDGLDLSFRDERSWAPRSQFRAATPAGPDPAAHNGRPADDFRVVRSDPDRESDLDDDLL